MLVDSPVDFPVFRLAHRRLEGTAPPSGMKWARRPAAVGSTKNGFCVMGLPESDHNTIGACQTARRANDTNEANL